MTLTWLLGLLVVYQGACVVGEPTLLGMGKSGGGSGSLKGASFEFSKGAAGLPSKVHGKGLDVDVDVLQLVTAGGVLKFLKDALEFRQGTSSYSLARDKDGRISVGDGKDTLLSFGGAYNGTESFSLNVAGPVEAPNIAALDDIVRGLQARVAAVHDMYLEGNRTSVEAIGEIVTLRDALQTLKDEWGGVEAARLLNNTRVNEALVELEGSLGEQCEKMVVHNATTMEHGQALVSHRARLDGLNATHMTLAMQMGADAVERAVFVHNISTTLGAHNATISALRDDVTELQANTSALWANVKGKVVELLVKDEAMASDVTHLLSNVTALNDSLHGHAQALTLLTTSHDQLALDSATQISDTATQIHTKMDTAVEGLSRRADTMDGALGQLDTRLGVSITEVADNITAVDGAAQAAVAALRLELTTAVQQAFTEAGDEHAAAVVSVVDSLHAVEAAAASNLSAVAHAAAQAGALAADSLAALEAAAATNLTAAVGVMQAMNTTLVSHVNDVHARLAAEMTGMQTQHDSLAAAVDARVGALDTERVVMNSALVALREATVSSTQESVDAMAARLESSSANLTAHIKLTATSLETRMEGMAGDAASNTTALQGEIAAVAAKSDTLGASLRTELSTQQDGLDALVKQSSEQKAGLAQHHEETTALAAALRAELQAEMDKRGIEVAALTTETALLRKEQEGASKELSAAAQADSTAHAAALAKLADKLETAVVVAKRDTDAGSTAAATAVGAVSAALAAEHERVSSVNASTHAALARLNDESQLTTTKQNERLTTLETSASEVRVAHTYITAGVDTASRKVAILEERVGGLREDIILSRANMTSMWDRHGMQVTLQEAALTALQGSLVAVKEAHGVTSTEVGTLKTSHATHMLEAAAAAAAAAAFKTSAESRFTAVDVSLTATQSKAAELTAAMAKTERSITALEKESGRASAAVETKITALKTASDVAVRRVEKVEGDSTAREAKTTALDKKVTALETKHKPLLADVSGLTTRITSVEGAVSGMKSEATAMKTAATAAAQRMTKMEGEAASQGTLLTKASTDATALRASVTKTDARVTAQEQAVSALQTAVRDSGVEHAAAVARLSDRLASDLTVLATKTDSTLASKTDLATLKTEVSTLTAKLAEVEKSSAVQQQAERDRAERAAQAAQAALQADLVAAGQRVTALETQVAAQDARLAKLEASLQVAEAATVARDRAFATTVALEATRASVDRLQTTMIAHAGKVLEAVVATNEVASNANVAVAQRAWKEAEQLWVQMKAVPAAAAAAAAGV